MSILLLTLSSRITPLQTLNKISKSHSSHHKHTPEHLIANVKYFSVSRTYQTHSGLSIKLRPVTEHFDLTLKSRIRVSTPRLPPLCKSSLAVAVHHLSSFVHFELELSLSGSLSLSILLVYIHSMHRKFLATCPLFRMML